MSITGSLLSTRISVHCSTALKAGEIRTGLTGLNGIGKIPEAGILGIRWILSFDLRMRLAAAGSDLCADRAGLFHSDGRRCFTAVPAIRIDEQVRSRLRGLERHNGTSIGFSLHRDLDTNQTQSPDRASLPHLDPDLLVRLRRSTCHHGDHDDAAE